jgi:hypothetical protein
MVQDSQIKPVTKVRVALPEAKITLITGSQRSGKSTTGIAYAIDDYYRNMTALVTPNGEYVKARALNNEEKSLLKSRGILYNVFNPVVAYSNDGKSSNIVYIPKGWAVASPVRIFANFHLYGVPFVYTDLAMLLQYLNDDLLKDAWLLSDESVMTSARNSTTKAGKLMQTFGATIGKRNLHFCLMTQYNRMAAQEFRIFATSRIDCTYDKKSHYIACDIDKNGEPKHSVSFWACSYWRFFDTNELIRVPQKRIDDAVASVSD